jgi:thermostable 8-oxoguanine DNA glycosylase
MVCRSRNVLPINEPSCSSAGGSKFIHTRSVREPARQSEQQLLTLLKQSGVDLPMASTLLRFRNRRAFQIIDRHAFRALRGYAYPLYPTSAANNKVRVFFEYFDDLHDLCNRFKLDFENIDRTLYVFDKRENGAL